MSQLIHGGKKPKGRHDLISHGVLFNARKTMPIPKGRKSEQNEGQAGERFHRLSYQSVEQQQASARDEDAGHDGISPYAIRTYMSGQLPSQYEERYSSEHGEQ
jgi:hypothetical protein